MECEVLRCGNPAESVVNVGTPGTAPIDAPVCDEHKARIEQGARWLYRDEKPSGSRLLMGRDLPLRAVHVGARDRLSPNGVTWVFTFVLEDPDGSQPTEFELPAEMADTILRILGRGRGEAGPAPDPGETGQG